MTKREIFQEIFNSFIKNNSKEEFIEDIDLILDADFMQKKKEIKDDIYIKGDDKEVIFQNNKHITYLKFRVFNN